VAWKLQRLAWKHGCADPEKCGLERPMKSRASKCPKRRGGGLVMVEPKSDRSRRTVKLPAPLVEELKAHRRWQRAERLALARSGWAGKVGWCSASPTGSSSTTAGTGLPGRSC
jgi:hypothetical protein